MATEPGPKPTKGKIPRWKPVNDGFVVYEVDCSVPNDPSVLKYPRVILPPDQPQPPPTTETPPPKAEGTPDPAPPGITG